MKEFLTLSAAFTVFAVLLVIAVVEFAHGTGSWPLAIVTVWSAVGLGLTVGLAFDRLGD